jgi:CheY-like chemotaxis protein/HPt (histidine-containing phosphotransfer) domain-containing protein
MEATAVAEAGSAAAACRAAREAGRPFAVAVVDGEPAARALADAGPPIVLLSAGIVEDGGAAGLGPSVVARMTKPVRQSELFNVLATLLGDGGMPAPDSDAAAPAASRPAARPLRILLAEDHPINQVVATHMLERLGHRTVVASHGRQALAAMESGAFDLVLMDLQMPVMDGFQALAAIRERERAGPGSRRTPVVALTAHAMAGDRERCLAGGFDGYLPKPIRSDELARALAELVRSCPPAAPGVAVFRPEVLAASCDGAAGIIAEVLDSFVAEAPSDLERIVGALAAGDLAEARRAAHGVRGACATVGAEALAEACLRIEAPPEGMEPPGAESARSALAGAWAPLLDAIEAHRETLEPARAAT